MPRINFDNYATLKDYAIIAQTSLTTVNTTTVNNGKYGNAAGAGATTGTFTATGSPSGVDHTNVGTATTELTALVNALNVRRAEFPQSTISGASAQTVTYLPNIDYRSGSSLTYDTTSTIQFDAGGTTNAQFFITAEAGSITFNGVSFVLLNGACAGNIFFRASAAITCTDFDSVGQGNLIAGTSITSAAAHTFNGRMYAQTAAVTFSGTSAVNVITCSDAICYAKGSQILTTNGYVPIENLNLGDRVITRGRINDTTYSLHEDVAKSIIWISKFTLKTLSSETRPVCIKAHAFGENVPFKDLYVSPWHGVLVGGLKIPAIQLINGTTVVQDYPDNKVTYYHFEVQNHSAVVANGVLAETYVGGMSPSRAAFEPSTRILPSFNDVSVQKPYVLRLPKRSE